MVDMFDSCHSLTSINISHFDTSNVKYLNCMFRSCYALTSVDLSNFKTEKLKEINDLFYNCTKLSYIDISTFHESLKYDTRLFENINSSGEIVISENISEAIHPIFENLKLDWTITEK